MRAMGIIGLVCFAVAAHADVKRKRVPVKVVEIAGGRAYLEPGEVAGLRRGQDVKIGGDAYRVVDTTSKHAAVDNPRGKLRVGDIGETTVALGDEPGSRAAPAPLSRFTGQWKDAVPPATRQKPKVVPLGPTGREGPVSLSLVEHGMVILPSAGGTVVAGELGARLSFEPWRDPLIGLDADASALLWAGDGLAGTPRRGRRCACASCAFAGAIGAIRGWRWGGCAGRPRRWARSTAAGWPRRSAAACRWRRSAGSSPTR